jgi:hypothetical protein
MTHLRGIKAHYTLVSEAPGAGPKQRKGKFEMWGFNSVPPRVTLLALVSAVIYVGVVLASL